MNRKIQDIVFESRIWLEKGCHDRVTEIYGSELARYSRLDAACDALESFFGKPPASR